MLFFLIRYLEFETHEEILFKFFLYHFLLTSILSLSPNNLFFEKSMYFPVVPDNSNDLLRSCVLFYEIIF